MDTAIETAALRKVYRAPKSRPRAPSSAFAPNRAAVLPAPGTRMPDGSIVALEGLDLTIGAGEFFGLLGPNGAGKTTTLGILTTRVLPTAGAARVHGRDVVREAAPVRRLIGVVPQRPNPDRGLSVLENLVFHATYFGFSRPAAQVRARAALERLGLRDRADARVDQISGGQQQRLMIARALVHEPQVVFLDEPTVGLDPQARLALWDILRALHADGRTIVMTTHYMEEADRLCDRVAIIDRGRLLACDTPGELKRRAPGGTLIELVVDGPAQAALQGARDVPGVLRAEAENGALRVYHPNGGGAVAALIGVVQAAGLQVTDIHLAPPSLETLFVSLTGRKLD